MHVIFLDFDGVLHSHSGPTCALFYFLPRLEAVLRDYPDARVVISSSWGERRSVEELRAFFSPDIQPRIVDKVRTGLTRMYGNGERADACRRFCRRHKLRAGDWLAIDDNSKLFQPSTPLIHCLDGFRKREELLLRMVLAEELPAWRFAFEVADELFGLEFKGDIQRTRQYVFGLRDFEDGSKTTLSQLLFARKRRAVERHMRLMDAARPPRPPLTDEELIEIHGDGPRYELIDGVLCIKEKK